MVAARWNAQQITLKILIVRNANHATMKSCICYHSVKNNVLKGIRVLSIIQNVLISVLKIFTQKVLEFVFIVKNIYISPNVLINALF